MPTTVTTMTETPTTFHVFELVAVESAGLSSAADIEVVAAVAVAEIDGVYVCCCDIDESRAFVVAECDTVTDSEVVFELVVWLLVRSRRGPFVSVALVLVLCSLVELLGRCKI